MAVDVRPDALGHEGRHPKEGLGLRRLQGHHLVGHVVQGARGRVGVVAELHVPQDEDPLPGDEDVVKDHQAVHLLHPAGEGVVKGAVPAHQGLPADEVEARGGGGKGEGQGVLLASRLEEGGGEDEDLVRQGEGGRHPGPRTTIPFSVCFTTPTGM